MIMAHKLSSMYHNTLRSNKMNTVIKNITYLITGSDSEYYTKELKPYLFVFILNLFGLAVLKIIKVLYFMYN
jgi:hypothetical protein